MNRPADIIDGMGNEEQVVITTLRLPKKIHEWLVSESKETKLSINQIILNILDIVSKNGYLVEIDEEVKEKIESLAKENRRSPEDQLAWMVLKELFEPAKRKDKT